VVFAALLSATNLEVDTRPKGDLTVFVLTDPEGRFYENQNVVNRQPDDRSTLCSFDQCVFNLLSTRFTVHLRDFNYC